MAIEQPVNMHQIFF